MARIAGIDLPKNKRGVIGLTYIYGIGRSSAEQILTQADVDHGGEQRIMFAAITAGPGAEHDQHYSFRKSSASPAYR